MGKRPSFGRRKRRHQPPLPALQFIAWECDDPNCVHLQGIHHFDPSEGEDSPERGKGPAGKQGPSSDSAVVGERERLGGQSTDN